MKKVLIVWIIIAVLLVGGLTIIGFKIKKQNKPYKDLEEKLQIAAEGYIGYYPNLLTSNEIRITNDELIDHDYSKKLNVNGQLCQGYVIVNKNMGMIEYDPYIKCKNYTTKGYSS